jgi:uncharacterized protein YjdB
MKHLIKLLLLLMALILPTTVSAYDCEVGSVYYNIYENDVTGNKAMVTFSDTINGSYGEHVYIPETFAYNGKAFTVVSIGPNAFANCTHLKSVYLPTTLKIINDYAFWNCQRLNNVTIPDKVTYIGTRAFYGCVALQNIVIPDLVKEILSFTFSACSSLKSVTIGASVTNISEYAFDQLSFEMQSLTWNAINCPKGINAYYPNLEIVTIGEGVQTVPSDFVPYSKIKAINIPNSVKTIGSGAFQECKELERVVVGDSVVTIDENAFRECSSLASVIMPNSVITIGDGAFWLCSSLTSIRLPNSVNTIGANAFRECKALEEVELGNSVKTIGKEAFAFCSVLSSIEIPGSLSFYGTEENRFYGCKNLSRVKLNEGITYIADGDFNGCTNLFDIELPNTLLYIMPYGFANSGLRNVKLPDSLIGLNYGAFYNCKDLTSVTIGKQLTGIGAYDMSSDFNYNPFRECSALMSIVVDPANTTFDSRDNCNSIIETATNTLLFGCNGSFVPNGVKTIGLYAFANSPGLVKLDIPESVTSIKARAFYNCSNLKILNFNAINCTEIGNIPDGSTSYRSPFDNNLYFQAVSFGDKVERIPANFPKFNMSNRNLVLPNSVKTIEAGALRGTAKAVVIGDNIESIAAGAVSSNITTAYVSSDTPRPCSAGAFAKPQTLYVPAGTKMKYFMADGWCEFANIEVKDFADDYVKADTIILDANNITLQRTSTRQLVATIMPNNYTAQKVTWLSVDPKIATVSSTGLVKGIANGVTDIVAYVDNVATRCRVTVSNLMVEELKLSDNSLQLELDDMVTLNAIITPDNAENKTLEWDIPDNNVIMTQIYNDTHSLNIGAIGEGTVTITARTTDGSNKSASCIVTVGKQELPGDVNGDGEVSIADINIMIDLVISESYQPEYDLNGDGEVNIADINLIIDLVLKK